LIREAPLAEWQLHAWVCVPVARHPESTAQHVRIMQCDMREKAFRREEEKAGSEARAAVVRAPRRRRQEVERPRRGRWSARARGWGRLVAYAGPVAMGEETCSCGGGESGQKPRRRGAREGGGAMEVAGWRRRGG